MSYLSSEAGFLRSILEKVGSETKRIQKGIENWEPPAFLLAEIEGAAIERLRQVVEDAKGAVVIGDGLLTTPTKDETLQEPPSLTQNI